MTKILNSSPLTGCCPTDLQSDERPLLSEELAAELESLFKVLSNGTRLRMLHAMVCCQEICVTDLAARLGMKPQAVSNQLQRLVDRRIVSCRRNGNNIFYKFVDPCVQILLERGLCLIEDIRDAAAHGVVWSEGNARPISSGPTDNEPSEPKNESGS
jgi:DNA-binding transcriptional ArsR family regulator